MQAWQECLLAGATSSIKRWSHSRQRHQSTTEHLRHTSKRPEAHKKPQLHNLNTAIRSTSDQSAHRYNKHQLNMAILQRRSVSIIASASYDALIQQKMPFQPCTHCCLTSTMLTATAPCFTDQHHISPLVVVGTPKFRCL